MEFRRDNFPFLLTKNQFIKKVHFILLGSLLSFNVMAKVKAISGLVTDVTGEPVIGASVVEVGTTNGVITDLNGKFSLNVSPNSQFLLSYIRYKQQTIKDGTESTYNIVLKEDAEVLDEVVVVGYGSQKKVNVTGAVGMVSAEALEARPVANASQALQGVVPGLNLTVGNNGGALDGTLNMNIRGAGTIGDGSGSSPLVLIDGIEGDLNTVNPNDIESVSVLKDAASASIYGARASFGVILVTTKSGKSGKTNVSYSGSARFSDAIGIPDIMDSYTFAQYFNRASANKGGGDIFAPAVMERIKAYQEGTLKATTVDNGAGIWQKWANANGNTDWFEEFYDHWAPSQEHNLSINGGTDKTQYLISGSFLDQKGLMRHGSDKFQRYTLNGKITTAVTDWFKVTYSTKWTREDFERPTYLTGSFFHNLARKWPVHPAYDPNGFPMDEGEVEQMENGGKQNSQKDFYTNQLQLVFEPIKNWKINLDGSVRTTTQYQHWEVLPVYAYNVDGDPYYTVWDMGYGSYAAGSSRVNEYSWKENYYTTNIYSDYFKQFDNGHYFKVMAGFNAELYKTRNITAEKNTLITPGVPTINTATDDPQAYGGYADNSVAGFFARVNWSYKDRYMFEANGRYDGSSRFVGKERWGFFPSFSAGWNVSREPFWRDLEHIVNNFKIRGSWGELGNCNTTAFYPFYQTMPTGVENSGWLINGKKPNTASAPGIVSAEMTWETVRSWNIGFDFGLLNNRLTGSFDYFVRNTLDMIGPAPQLPATLGATVPKVNNADMKAWGFEVEVSWRDRIKDFNYGVKFVLSDDQRKVTRYPNEELNRNQWYAGRMDGLVWGYETVGIAKTDAEMEAHLSSLPNGGQSQLGSKWAAGDIMYKDLNGDGKISSGDGTLNDLGDLKVVANTQLRFKYGLTLDASWKGFDFSAFFQGVGKRDVVVGGPYFWGANGQGMWQAAAFKDHMDYFRPEDTESVFGPNVDAYYPRVIFGGGSSEGGKNTLTQSRYVQNGAYIRLKNLQLGYTLPSTITKKFAVNSLRVYVSGDNLWTGTKMRVFDPEVLGSTGDAGKAYPLARVWSVGLNVNF